jgi:hypothetical protein
MGAMTQTIEVRELQTEELGTGKLAVRVGAFSAAPEDRLFSPRAVAIATLVGTPAAGSALMVVNYRRMGRVGRGVAVGLAGLAVTATAIWIGMVSARVADWLMALALVVGMRLTAEGLQGKAVERHLREGGRREPVWLALGIGVLFLVGIWGMVVLLAKVQAV